jgi:hypothetical protein
LLDPDLPCALRHGDELFCFLIDSTDSIHAWSITEVSIDYARDIDIEYISFFEYFVCARYTMTDDIIDRYTSTARVSSLSPFVIPEIVYTCWCSTIFQGESIHDSIELERRYSWTDVLPDHVEHTCGEVSCLTDSSYLFGCFDEYFSHDFIFLEDIFAV